MSIPYSCPDIDFILGVVKKSNDISPQDKCMIDESLEKLRHINDLLRADTHDLMKERDDLEDRIKDLEKDLEDSHRQILDLNDEVIALRKKLVVAEDDYDLLEHEVVKLRENNSDLQATIDSLQLEIIGYDRRQYDNI